MDQPFFFGASTSSHQVEGDNHNDWTEWELLNAKVLAAAASAREWDPKRSSFILEQHPDPLLEANYISGKASGHYERFREDFDIAKSLGHNAHRFSIEWSRVEPSEGVFDEHEIAHYCDVVKALRERGMEPFVTLWHWTLPVWLAKRGGVLAKRFPEYFERYTRTLAAALGEDVHYWITVNEPGIFSFNAYFEKRWPPQRNGYFLSFRAQRRIIAAHKRAVVAIKNINPGASVGVAENVADFESAGGLVNGILRFGAEYIWSSYFLNRVHRTLDFIGVNYYFHNRIDGKWNVNANAVLSDFGWEVYPKGIYNVLMRLARYKLPIIVTENGIADARDMLRGKFIEEHVAWMKKAMEDGADVRGYLHWSLLDNFEWDSGFWPRFGLVEVDYKTMERRIRPSALRYKTIIEEWNGTMGK